MGPGQVLTFLLSYNKTHDLPTYGSSRDTGSFPGRRHISIPRKAISRPEAIKHMTTAGKMGKPGNSAFHPGYPVASTKVRLRAQTRGSSHTHLHPRFPASLGMSGRSHLKAAGVKWNMVVRRLGLDLGPGDFLLQSACIWTHLLQQRNAKKLQRD